MRKEKAAKATPLMAAGEAGVMPMKKNNRKTQKDVLSFVGLAYQDYLSARLLLLNGFLPQGTGMAATAVEKTLKGIILVKGNRCKGHLEQNLLNAIENQQPNLFSEINIDFIKFLRKAYKLRYHDDKKDKFGIVINQYRTLAELDIMIAVLDSGFKLKKGDSKQKTPYQNGIDNGDEMLLKENHILNGISIEQYFTRQNKVYEIMIEPGSNGLTVTYETDGVNNNGSFLKPVDLSTSKQQMQLTFGGSGNIISVIVHFK